MKVALHLSVGMSIRTRQFFVDYLVPRFREDDQFKLYFSIYAHEALSSWGD